MSGKPRNYLYVADGDHSATIDFASFHTNDGMKVEEVKVKLTVVHDEHTGTALLHVYAISGEYSKIILEESPEIEVSEPEKKEKK